MKVQMISQNVTVLNDLAETPGPRQILFFLMSKKKITRTSRFRSETHLCQCVALNKSHMSTHDSSAHE